MFRAHSSHQPPSYPSLLLGVLDRYLKENENSVTKTEGRQRAAVIKRNIQALVRSRRHTDEQIMWLVMEMASIGNIDGPLGTSMALRRDILENLCEQLHVTGEIEQRSSDIYVNQVRYVQSAASPFANYVPDMNVVRCEAMEALIKFALKPKLAAMQGGQAFKENVMRVIQEYREEMANKWFTFDGRCRSERLERSIHIWSDIVKMNDLQLLLRVREEVIKPIESRKGMLETSKRLRYRLARCMSAYLGCGQINDHTHDENNDNAVRLGIRIHCQQITEKLQESIKKGPEVAAVPMPVRQNRVSLDHGRVRVRM